MKKKISFKERHAMMVCLLLSIAGFVSCGDDSETTEESSTWFGTPEVVVSGTTAQVSCQTSFGVGILTSENAGFVYTEESSGSSETVTGITISGSTLSCQLLNLLSGADYTVYAFVDLNGTRLESSSVSFSIDEAADSGTDDGSLSGSLDLSVYTGYAELPDMYADASDCYYMVHYCSGLPGNRNYTVCYSATQRIGLWSAFPLHECYKGDQSRSDAWAWDADLPQSIQPALTTGSYQPQIGYSRGHLIASSDRTVSSAANIQTFYVTNVAPQWQNSFNSGVWSSLESQCWNNICADTLYVVSGVWGVHDTAEVTDKSGEPCTVPSHFYRVLLRSKTGETGKKVQDLEADELQCVGFWFENRAYSNGKPSENMTSVADIEAKTGMTFFVNVPNAPKDTYDASDWSF